MWLGGLSFWDRAIYGGGARLLDAFALGLTQRIDIVGLGDSNQVQGGLGWDHGIQYALVQSGIQMYATGLIAQNENSGNGSGVGYTYNRNGALIGAVTGAPSELGAYLDKGAGGLFPYYYAYVADGGSVVSTFNHGLNIIAGGAMDVRAALDFDFHDGTFDSGSGAFRPCVRISASPFTILAGPAAVSTNAAAFGMRRTTVSISADATRTANLQGMFTRPGATGITGPFFGLYLRASDPARTTGFSYHTLDYRGGQSTRTLAVDLQEASDETLSYFFAETRRLQGDEKTVVIMVNSGLNDRNETNASVGPAAVSDADSPEAYVDNLTAIVERVQEIWTLNDWAAEELHFVFMPSHPISTPDDAELLSYRAAAKVYAAGLAQATVIDLDERAGEAHMLANGWYASGGSDRNHLTQAGYEGAGLLAVR